MFMLFFADVSIFARPPFNLVGGFWASFESVEGLNSSLAAGDYGQKRAGQSQLLKG